MRFCRGGLARLRVDDTGEIMERRILRVLFQCGTDDGLRCREVVARQQRADLLQCLFGRQAARVRGLARRVRGRERDRRQQCRHEHGRRDHCACASRLTSCSFWNVASAAVASAARPRRR